MQRRWITAALGAMLVFAAPAAADTTITSCSSQSQATQPLSVTVGGQTATGLYSLPQSSPRGIVVVGHGFPGTASTWASVVQEIATDDDVIALAMDYRGTDLQTGLGWRVIEGAQDSIAATQLFDSACQGSGSFTNAVFGISMGGDMSGIAVSSGAKRASGASLFDYWFDVSGVTNLLEAWTDAEVVSSLPVGSIATTAGEILSAMQTEFGGSPLTVPLSYLSYSPVARTSQMRSSGLKGVVISHSVLDGEVTSDMGAQMAAALVATGIPTDVYTAVFKYPSTITGNGLTLDGDLIGTLDSSYSSPSAGHVSPVVLDAALSRLTALYSQGTAPSGVSLTLDDGQLGVVPLIP